jgi:hypothetical protein
VGTPVVIMPDAGCVTHTHTVCVPECSVKTREKVVYSSGCEKFCLPACRLCGGHGDCAHCECPRTRKYLIKKIEKCEENVTKCVPSEQPACGGGHCIAAPRHAAATPIYTAPPLAVAPGGSVISIQPVGRIVTSQVK